MTGEKKSVEDNKKSTGKSAKSRAEELMKRTIDGKHVSEMFGEAINKQYLINGKSMQAWKMQFSLRIPENPDPAQCKRLASQLAALFHEATFYFSLAEAQLDALQSGEFHEFTATFQQMVTDYQIKHPGKSLPAQKTLETLAHGRMLDVKGAINNTKISKNFWKRILESLTEVRKNLEIASKNNYIQLQLERGETNIPQHTPNRGTFGSPLDDD